MSQAHINAVRTVLQQLDVGVEKYRGRTKATMHIDKDTRVSVYKNKDGEIVVNIRKLTRNVTIPAKTFTEICDSRDIVQLCCSFVDNYE